MFRVYAPTNLIGEVGRNQGYQEQTDRLQTLSLRITHEETNMNKAE
jgi:hypothetical protein